MSNIILEHIRSVLVNFDVCFKTVPIRYTNFTSFISNCCTVVDTHIPSTKWIELVFRLDEFIGDIDNITIKTVVMSAMYCLINHVWFTNYTKTIGSSPRSFFYHIATLLKIKHDDKQHFFDVMTDNFRKIISDAPEFPLNTWDELDKLRIRESFRMLSVVEERAVLRTLFRVDMIINTTVDYMDNTLRSYTRVINVVDMSDSSDDEEEEIDQRPTASVINPRPQLSTSVSENRSVKRSIDKVHELPTEPSSKVNKQDERDVKTVMKSNNEDNEVSQEQLQQYIEDMKKNSEQTSTVDHKIEDVDMIESSNQEPKPKQIIQFGGANVSSIPVDDKTGIGDEKKNEIIPPVSGQTMTDDEQTQTLSNEIKQQEPFVFEQENRIPTVQPLDFNNPFQQVTFVSGVEPKQNDTTPFINASVYLTDKARRNIMDELRHLQKKIEEHKSIEDPLKGLDLEKLPLFKGMYERFKARYNKNIFEKGKKSDDLVYLVRRFNDLMKAIDDHHSFTNTKSIDTSTNEREQNRVADIIVLKEQMQKEMKQLSDTLNNALSSHMETVDQRLKNIQPHAQVDDMEIHELKESLHRYTDKVDELMSSNGSDQSSLASMLARIRHDFHTEISEAKDQMMLKKNITSDVYTAVKSLLLDKKLDPDIVQWVTNRMNDLPIDKIVSEISKSVYADIEKSVSARIEDTRSTVDTVYKRLDEWGSQISLNIEEQKKRIVELVDTKSKEILSEVLNHKEAGLAIRNQMSTIRDAIQQHVIEQVGNEIARKFSAQHDILSRLDNVESLIQSHKKEIIDLRQTQNEIHVALYGDSKSGVRGLVDLASKVDGIEAIALDIQNISARVSSLELTNPNSAYDSLKTAVDELSTIVKDDLSITVKTLQTDISNDKIAYNKFVVNTSISLQELHTKIDQLENAERNDQQSLTRVSEKLSELEGKQTAEYSSDLDALKKRLFDLEHSTDNATLMNELVGLKGYINIALHDISKYSKVVSDMARVQSEYAHLINTSSAKNIRVLEYQVSLFKTDNDDLKKQIESQRTIITNLTEKVHSVEEDIRSKAESDLKTASEKLIELQTQLHNKTSEYDRASNELKLLQQTHQSQTTELEEIRNRKILSENKRLNELEVENVTIKQELQTLETNHSTTVRQLEQTVNSLKSDLEQKTREVTNQTDQIQQAVASKDDMTKKYNELVANESSQVSKLKQELEEAKKSIAGLNAEKTTLLKSASDHKTDLTKAMEKLQTLDDSIDEYKKKVIVLETSVSQANEQKDQQTQQLQHQIDHLDLVIQSLSTSEKKARQSNEELKVQLTTSESSLKLAIETHEKEKRQLIDRTNSLEADITTLKQTIMNKDKDINTMTSSYNDLNSRFASIKDELETAKKELSQHQQQYQKLLETANITGTDNGRLMEQITSIQKSMKELSDAYNDLLVANVTKSKDFEELSKSIDSMVKQYLEESDKKKKAALLVRINKLRSEYRRLIGEEEEHARYTIDEQKKKGQVLVDIAMYDIYDKQEVTSKLEKNLQENRAKLVPVLSITLSNPDEISKRLQIYEREAMNQIYAIRNDIVTTAMTVANMLGVTEQISGIDQLLAIVYMKYFTLDDRFLRLGDKIFADPTKETLLALDSIYKQKEPPTIEKLLDILSKPQDSLRILKYMLQIDTLTPQKAKFELDNWESMSDDLKQVLYNVNKFCVVWGSNSTKLKGERKNVIRFLDIWTIDPSFRIYPMYVPHSLQSIYKNSVPPIPIPPVRLVTTVDTLAAVNDVLHAMRFRRHPMFAQEQMDVHLWCRAFQTIYFYQSLDVNTSEENKTEMFNTLISNGSGLIKWIHLLKDDAGLIYEIANEVLTCFTQPLMLTLRTPDAKIDNVSVFDTIRKELLEDILIALEQTLDEDQKQSAIAVFALKFAIYPTDENAAILEPLLQTYRGHFGEWKVTAPPRLVLSNIRTVVSPYYDGQILGSIDELVKTQEAFYSINQKIYYTLQRTPMVDKKRRRDTSDTSEEPAKKDRKIDEDETMEESDDEIMSSNSNTTARRTRGSKVNPKPSVVFDTNFKKAIDAREKLRKEGVTSAKIDLYMDQKQTDSLTDVVDSLSRSNKTTSPLRIVIEAMEPESKYILEKVLVHISRLMIGLNAQESAMVIHRKNQLLFANSKDGEEFRRVLLEYVEYYTDFTRRSKTNAVTKSYVQNAWWSNWNATSEKMDDRFKVSFDCQSGKVDEFKLVNRGAANSIVYLDLFASGKTPSKQYKGPMKDMVKMLKHQHRVKKSEIDRLEKISNTTVNSTDAINFYDKFEDYNKNASVLFGNQEEDDEYDNSTENTGFY
jgi:chromosome segregation ATPase